MLMIYEITLYDPETQDTCGTAVVNTEQALVQEIKDAIHDGYCAIVSGHKGRLRDGGTKTDKEQQQE